MPIILVNIYRYINKRSDGAYSIFEPLGCFIFDELGEELIIIISTFKKLTMEMDGRP